MRKQRDRAAGRSWSIGSRSRGGGVGMGYDLLFEPVSEAEPCGPDLDDVGDEKYLNYVLSVTSRIPERYYRADTDKPVDRAEIKLKDEVETIGSLLKQTRDVRLLCIEVRFQSFAGE